ncbi:caspase domain-containing protein [Mycena vulgaris]|nr:caspase domain-containing protein [Mycena vulgaris]
MDPIHGCVAAVQCALEAQCRECPLLPCPSGFRMRHRAICHPTFVSPREPSFSSSTSTLDTTGRKQALLIGIRGTKTASKDYPELKGSHKDVENVRNLLVDCYGYAFADITTLIDDDIPGHTQPTRENILLAIAAFVKDAQPGDRFAFHYSGHSTQIKNRSNSEEDGMDECLIPSDGEAKYIQDNELNDALVKPLPSGSHLVAVLDTCHSGSLLGTSASGLRKNARLPSVSTLLTGRKTAPPARTTTRMLAKRSEINMNLVCCPPPVAPASSGSPADGTRQRTYTYSSRTVSFPSSEKENVGVTAGDAAPALCGKFRVLPEEDQCDSPIAMFECTGWCHNDDKFAAAERGKAEPSSDGIKADVLSLASCKDSQLSWEDEEGRSMTSALIDILRRNPNQSLKDVLVHISHAMYTKALLRHESGKAYNKEHKNYVDSCDREMEELRRTISLVLDDPAPGPLVASPTFPSPRKPSFFARRMEKLKRMKRIAIESKQSAVYDMDNFQNPELASKGPLDMSREWRM